MTSAQPQKIYEQEESLSLLIYFLFMQYCTASANSAHGHDGLAVLGVQNLCHALLQQFDSGRTVCLLLATAEQRSVTSLVEDVCHKSVTPRCTVRQTAELAESRTALTEVLLCDFQLFGVTLHRLPPHLQARQLTYTDAVRSPPLEVQ